MTRILLQYILPLFLPVAIFLIWVLVSNRARKGGKTSNLEKGNWVWALLVGVVLMAGVLVYTALSGGGDPKASYHPPRYEDGKVIPGGFGDPPR